MSTAPPGLAGRHFWERTTFGWHLVFAAMIAMAAVALLPDQDIPTTRLWQALALGTLWVAWYVGFGAPSMMREGRP